jgi:peroxiredoxin
MLNRSTLGLMVLIAAMLMGVYTAHVQSVGQPAPGFSLPNGYGGRLDLASYRGHPVLLVFWTTWCGICQRELPLLNDMRWDFERRGVSVLAINVGGQGDTDNYMRANHIFLTSVVDADGTVGRNYRVSGVPALVLVGKDGNIKRRSSGWTGQNVLRDWIADFGGS